MGNAIVSCPYATTEDLSSSTGVTPSVNFNGSPAYVLEQSTQPTCKGDSPGSATGVRSGTVGGEVKPTGSSKTVFSEGRLVVRDGDSNTMNGGNNPGTYVTASPPDSAPPKSAAANSDPPPAPEEEGWLASAAHYYKDNLSETAHGFATDAMDVGGNVALAGGVTMAGGAVVASTGVGLPVAAAMEAGGVAAVAVGGGFSTVGGVTDATATGLDMAADYMLTGKMPDLLPIAMSLAEKLVLNKIMKWLPGSRNNTSAMGAVEKNEVKAAEKAAKNEAKAAEKGANRVTVHAKKPTIDEKRSKHTFGNRDGHLQDTPENRKLLEDTAADKGNFLGTDGYGNDCYAKVLDDGSQVWTYVRDGKVVNGGLNAVAKTYNSLTGLSAPGK